MVGEDFDGLDSRSRVSIPTTPNLTSLPESPRSMDSNFLSFATLPEIIDEDEEQDGVYSKDDDEASFAP